MTNFDALFQPISIGSMEVKNRLVMAPMVTNYCENDGAVSERLKAYFSARARGGVGFIIAEATYVHPSGKGFPNELGVYKDELIPGLKELVDEIHRCGAKVALQLYHSGRQSYSTVTGGTLMAPSAIPCPICQDPPREMTTDDIDTIIEAFGEGARRAKTAGFDAVEIHGAHGYLINQFLSGYSNQRSDQYGGSLENRARFPLATLKRVRQAVGDDFPMTYRMSSVEHVSGGLTLEDTTAFAAMLVDNSIDGIHVSGGVYESAAMIIQPAAVPQGVYVDNAAAIKAAVKGRVPVIAVGRIKDPVMAQEVVASGKADLVAMARPFLADPDFPAKVQAGKPEEIRRCIGCNQGCIDRLFTGVDINCQVNALAGQEYQYDLTQKAPAPKRVLVVGGGPAGLEAARVAAFRGHEVMLYEKSDKLGGQLNTAAIPPFKGEINELVDFLAGSAERLGVKIVLGQAVDEQVIDQIRPDEVVMATGSVPVVPDMPGIGNTKEATARDVLMGVPGAFAENVVVIGGGSTGCETAECLAEAGAHVKVLEMQSDVVTDVGLLRKFLLIDRMGQKGVEILTEKEVKELKADGVVVEKEGAIETIGDVDAVVWAVGNKPDITIEPLLKAKKIPFHKVGDCVAPRKITDAIHEGFRCGYAL